MSDIFGYFDSPGQARPAFDPGRGVMCPICLHTLGDDRRLKAISLMAVGDDRSYFFRAHRDCWDAASDEEKADIESSLIDSIQPIGTS